MRSFDARDSPKVWKVVTLATEEVAVVRDSLVESGLRAGQDVSRCYLSQLSFIEARCQRIMSRLEIVQNMSFRARIRTFSISILDSDMCIERRYAHTKYIPDDARHTSISSVGRSHKPIQMTQNVVNVIEITIHLIANEKYIPRLFVPFMINRKSISRTNLASGPLLEFIFKYVLRY